MNTEQNYVGKGNYANNPPQTDATASKSPSTPDNRPGIPISREALAWEYQNKLLMLVDSYLEWTSPILAITELLEGWLTTPPIDLSNEHNQHQLGSVLKLIDFMTELRDAHDAWLTYTNDVNKEKKEVNNG